jgi:hypothetical protein
MNSTARFIRSLRAVAAALFIGGLAIWAFSGARLGWTQTSIVTTQRDEITGIDYPVRKPGFIAGIEVPLLATIAAAALVGASFLPRRAASRV